MKIIQQLLSSKLGRYIVGIFIILFLISNWVSNRPEAKTTRQIGSSSDPVQKLWVRKMYLWNHITDWSSNTIYVTDPTAFNEKLIAINSLTGSTIWEVSSMGGVKYLFTDGQTVFAVSVTQVNAYRASTGELLWSTKIGDGHVSWSAQYDGSIIRVYYGEELIEISQRSGEILTRQPIRNIIWIQNNVEIQCPLMNSKDKRDQACFIGLTGIDRSNRKTLWKNKYTHFSEYYQEQGFNNMAFVGFSVDGICALNPDTGEYRWCLPGGKISNIAPDQDEKIGYFLRYDFSLVKINLLTGGILAETQFLPKVLPTEMQQHSYGYKVAVTKDTVIVSFGDSDQTFGLSINP